MIYRSLTMDHSQKHREEQRHLNSAYRHKKRGKGHRHTGRKRCPICTASSVGKALRKGHGNMKEYRSNYSFSEEDTAIFGDNDFVGLLDWDEFVSLLDEFDDM